MLSNLTPVQVGVRENLELKIKLYVYRHKTKYLLKQLNKRFQLLKWKTENVEVNDPPKIKIAQFFALFLGNIIMLFIYLFVIYYI